METESKVFGKMEVKKVDIKDLKPNKYNPNEMDPEMFKGLVEEIKTKGMRQPILVNKDMTIIDGQHRWEAAKAAGIWSKVWVVQIEEDVDEAMISTINMNNLKGITNPVKLAELLKELQERMHLDQLSEALYMDKTEIEALGLLSELPDEAEEAFVSHGPVGKPLKFDLDDTQQKWVVETLEMAKGMSKEEQLVNILTEWRNDEEKPEEKFMPEQSDGSVQEVQD